MDNAEIETVIATELTTIAQGATGVTADTNIVRDLSLDSLAVMDLVMALEDHFDISIPLDRIAETETVKQLAAVVQSLQNEVEA